MYKYKGNLEEIIFDPSHSSALAMKAIEAERNAGSGLRFGIHGLDRHFVMNKRGKLVGVYAYTSHGKTAFLKFAARNFLTQLDKDNEEIGIFWTSEDSVESFAISDMSIISKVPMSSVYNGSITEADMKKMVKAGAERSEKPLWIVGHSDYAESKTFNPRLTMTDFLLVMENILEKQKRNVRFVMIDYLQLINIADNTDFDTTRTKFNASIKAMRDLAHGYNLTVYCATQVKRDVSERKWNMPQLADAQETSGFEQSCDAAIGLWYVHRNWPLMKVVQEAMPNSEAITVTKQLVLAETLKQKDGDANIYTALDFLPEYGLYLPYGEGMNFIREQK